MFLATGADAVTAYTATSEMEITAGQNAANSIVAQLGVQIQAVVTRIGEVETNLKSDLATVKTDLAGVKTDVAVLKKEVRLIWAALFLAVPTLTAVLVRLFGG